MDAKKKVLIPVSTGTEELEFVAIYDILVRAGAEVTVAKVNEPGKSEKTLTFTGAQKLVMTANVLIEDCTSKEYDLIVLPGGMPNAEYLGKCKPLVDMLKKQKTSKKLYGAICASPVLALNVNGLLDGEVATCYPSMQKDLGNKLKPNERVVVSNKCITSQGPCTGSEYGFKLVEILYGKPKADELIKGMVFKS